MSANSSPAQWGRALKALSVDAQREEPGAKPGGSTEQTRMVRELETNESHDTVTLIKPSKVTPSRCIQ